MFQFKRIFRPVFFCFFFISTQLDGFSVLSGSIAKRDINQDIQRRIGTVGILDFDSEINPSAKERRTFACFFVFDREASADLNNDIQNANSYATQLAALTSRYMAHANMRVINAGTELWTSKDEISFAPGQDPTSSMPDFLQRFQTYLNETQRAKFGTTYAVGVLISNKNRLVAGGFSQGPPCTTSGAMIINYRQMPWSIAGLLAHELAHTLSVVHPMELPYLCPEHKALSFCSLPSIPEECNCASSAFPPERCLMTFQFGRAKGTAAKYTSCDIAMMNYFSSNIGCLLK